MKTITKKDLLDQIADSVNTQVYKPKPVIEGVKIVELKQFVGEDGSFEELLRIDEKGVLQQFPDFQIRQIGRSQLLPGAIKAWHLHFNQEDIWYIAPQDHMLLGLWDLRKKSPSKDIKMRITMGAGTARLIYIPRGVAHGVMNLNHETGDILYILNQQFNATSPDENRLPWDAAGTDFWQPIRG